jgi:hypothetical protein
MQPNTAYSYPAEAQTWEQFAEATWDEVDTDVWFLAVGL